MQFGQRPKTVNLKIFLMKCVFLEHFLRRASVQFGNPAEKLKKKSERSSVKLSLHTVSAVLERTECKSCFLSEIPENFSENLELLVKLIATKRLFGHIKSSFDIFIEKGLPKVQKWFASSRKKDKQFFGVLRNLFSPEDDPLDT